MPNPEYIDNTTVYPEGWDDSIMPILPTSHLSNRKVRLLARDHARANDELTSDIESGAIDVGSTDKHSRIYRKAFNRELKKARKKQTQEQEKSDVERQVAEMMSNND